MESKNANNSRGYTEGAMKVNKVRTSRARLNKKIRFYSAAAFFGLGAVGSSYAIIAAGVLAAGFAGATLSGERNVIKSQAKKHKFKKIAKRVKRELGINIRPEFNYETRQAGFVLCDMSGQIPITSFLTSENAYDYLTPEQVEGLQFIIDDEFAYANSYRGKGNDYRTLREFEYKDSPKISFDNLTCAFDDVGGVLSNNELLKLSSGYKLSRIECDKFIKKHKNEELWVFSAHLSEYLSGLTDMSPEDKMDILNEFIFYFEKYDKEGEYQFQKLRDQIKEENEIKKAM